MALKYLDVRHFVPRICKQTIYNTVHDMYYSKVAVQASAHLLLELYSISQRGIVDIEINPITSCACMTAGQQ